MTKINFFGLAACLALCLLSSCKKVYDYIQEHPDAYSPPCRITNFRVVSVAGREANYVFTYNRKGNPISMMDSNRITPAGYDQYFRYDKQERLSDFMLAYAGNFGAVAWHKYFYLRPDYIIDTVMFYDTGDVREPSPIAKNTNQYRISAYTLDNFDRIIKIWSIPNDLPNTPSLQSVIVYDANGNAPLPGAGLSYDKKVNLYRTNKVWQFVYMNYSRNNLVSTDGNYFPRYNDFGLPLNPLNQRWFNYPFNQYNAAPEANADYSCAISKGPVVY
ncbi:MAG: hypothetical protein JST42_23630 [Bacteroidetes bacterium]|nr:hypothetical protein [Bacteroidota bacterium]